MDSPVFGVIDIEGGNSMVEAFAALQAYGRLLSVGHTARTKESFPVGAFEGDFGREGKRIETMHLLERGSNDADLGRDIEWLAEHIAEGTIVPPETQLVPFPMEEGIDVSIRQRSTFVL
ncbi:hypothetical protein GCM10027169_32690 [Gordonia jinhuaensis]|uniref:Uncharacterized protein n=1 Tax=Gordonia jinhuaensis TaxID=1517702 RepID=A0A916WVI8_9ACTN|nr:hypothetical protein GCM10011489_21830 [Gordonia jinhuaensis]